MMTCTHGVIEKQSSISQIFESDLITLNVGDAIDLDFIGVIGDSIDVDFGDGSISTFNFTGTALNILGNSILTNNVNVISSGVIVKFKVNSNTFSSIIIPQSSTLTNLSAAFFALTNLTSFLINDSSNVTNFQSTWRLCSGLLVFNAISLASAINLNGTFSNMTGLSSFPLLVIPATVNDIDFCWQDCSGLGSFPAIDFSNMIADSLDSTWRDCSSIVDMPSVISSTVMSYLNTWRDCALLKSIGGLSTSSAIIFNGGFANCASLECLTSIDTTSNTSTTDLFLNTPLLTNPDATEQSAILAGSNYVNANPCP